MMKISLKKDNYLFVFNVLSLSEQVNTSHWKLSPKSRFFGQ